MVLPPQNVFNGGMAQLSVGPDNVQFNVHIELLRAISPFFRKAFDGNFLEANTKHISLPEDEPTSVAAMLSWAYPYVMGRITFHTDKFNTEAAENGWLELTKLWVLGDKYQMPAFQNHAMRCLFAKFRIASIDSTADISPETFHYLYANTVSSARLRDVLHGMAVRHMSLDYFASNCDIFPRQFIMEFSIKNMSLLRSSVDVTRAMPDFQAKRYFLLDVEYVEDKAKQIFIKQEDLNDMPDKLTPVKNSSNTISERANARFTFNCTP